MPLKRSSVCEPNPPQVVRIFAAAESMTAEQAAMLKQLAWEAYEPEAFRPHLTRVQAQSRIAALTAKLKLLDGPPHTL